MPQFVDNLLRAGEGRTMRELEHIVAKVNLLEDDYRALSDDELRDETPKFRDRLEKGATLDDILPEAFAAVREASRRTLGKPHFDVQIMAGAALHKGNVAEARTGEGKSITVDTAVPTPSGFVRAGELKVGDTLFDRLGRHTRITGVYPQGMKRVFRVTLSDGRSVLCNDEHLWGVCAGKNSDEFEVLTTSELMLIKGISYLPRAHSTSTLEHREDFVARLDSVGRNIRGLSWMLNDDLSDDVRRQFELEAHSLGMDVSHTSRGVLIRPDGSDRVSIARIEDLGYEAEQVCFTVDNDEHLFLVGDYVVTHNTLVATLPSYLNAIEGKGVHVVTVNDYLASSQAEQMSRVHRALGLETGCILAEMDPPARRAQYAKDITYGTNNEFGFDYLRDNMAMDPSEMVQRGHNFAIVDEVDSILIDEARTPLIISGPADGDPKWFTHFAELAAMLTRAEKDPKTGDFVKHGDYTVDEKKKTIGILEAGIEKVEDWLGIDNLYDDEQSFLISYLNNAIKAKELFKRNKDYVSMDGEIKIVDEHTGRILDGRRYNDGIHQAIEAKEGVEIKPENQTLASITLQNYFRLYSTLSGMTGTAQTEAAEFYKTYSLGVVTIPTNNPPQRVDLPDRIFVTEDDKFAAVAKEIATRHEHGQPVLVGTTSVSKSEKLSSLLTKLRIPHEVLNAKHHGSEAAIVARAGRKRAVTVATNMAGRGTDIILGGNPEFMATEELHARGLNAETTPNEFEELWEPTLARIERRVQSEHDEVKRLGGLYVIGTERHESRRIDNQLRGRSGRQGDPGMSRFFMSLDDDLVRLFAANLTQRFQSAGFAEGEEIQSKMVLRAIASAQSQLEGQHYDTRKNILKYDDVINAQRKVIYAERRQALRGDVTGLLRAFLNDVVDETVGTYTVSGFSDDWDFDGLWTRLHELYPVNISLDELEVEYGSKAGLTPEDLEIELRSDAQYAFDERIAAEGWTPEQVEQVERAVILTALDTAWREHLYEMDYLKEGIHLRQMAQRDPLIEYQREGYRMYNEMVARMKAEAVSTFFFASITPTQAQQELNAIPLSQMSFIAPNEDGEAIEAPIASDGHVMTEDDLANRATRRAKTH